MIMRIIPWNFILICSIIFLGTSCISEDRDDCVYRLKFKYDYNMDYIDMFPEKVDRVDVFVFDDKGLFVQEITEVTTTQFPEDFGIELYLPVEKEYTFLTWGGWDKSQYDITKLVPGKTSIAEVELGLKDRSSGFSNINLTPLWYGKLTTVVKGSGEAVVPLIKDSNKFRIAVRLLPTAEENTPPKHEEFDIFLESDNTLYDSNNKSMSSKAFRYRPYYKENDNRGFILELNTLRLIAGRTNNLIFADPDTHETLLSINLNEYLEDLKFLENSKMDFQEFLDREDEFAVIFYFGSYAGNLFSSFIVEINDWVIRKQNEDNI